MEILECWLKHYGKFTDYRITFHAGLNIIEGGNESGKSTVFSFIRSMLYGIRKNRSRNLDEYQLRQPWDDPDHFAGSMKVHMNGKIYRIDRNFLRKDESLSVVCETEGREVGDPQGFLTELTGGLSEEDFINTIYIRQAQAPTDAQLGEDLRDYLVNVKQSGHSSTNVTWAVELLKKKRRELEAEKKKSLGGISGKLEDNRREAEYVRGEIGRLQQKLDGSGKEDETAFVRKPAEHTVSAAGADTAPEGAGPEDGKDDVPEDPADEGCSRQQAAAAGEISRKRRELEEDSSGEDRDTEFIPPVLPLLLFATSGMAALCSIFARGNVLRYVLLALCIVFAAGGIWAMLRRKGQENRRQNPAKGGPCDEKEAREESRSDRKLRRAERSVKRYDSLNRMFGYRDDSVDPELEARKRRLADAREKAMREEEARTRSETASDVARIMRQNSADFPQNGQTPGQPESSSQAALSRAAASGRSDALARELREKQKRLEELDAQFSSLSGKKDGLLDRELQAVDLATQRILSLSRTIYRETGEDFSRRLSEILSRLTQGRYTSISMDERMELNINTPDRLLRISQVSYGTACQIYFALRFAAGELLSGSADLPLLLDEPFAMYDDARLKDTLRFLAGCGHQILLFTCQSREKVFSREI